MKEQRKIRRNMKISLGIFVVLFSMLIVYMAYSIITNGGKWFATPYNPRITEAMQTGRAGAITDRNGVKLAWTEQQERKYSSDKDVRRAMCHVVGDTYGKSIGAETVFAKYIYGIDKDVLSRLEDVLAGKGKGGTDIALTVDAGISEYIYDNMGAKRGSVVVLNYKTGEIIASVSIPTFDPNTLANETPENTSLVDRATMGRYPPGSIMKILTATLAVREDAGLTYTCTGEDIVQGQKVTCTKKHGKLNLEQAFAKSCNTYFANLSVELGGSALKANAEKFGFNTAFNFADVQLYRSNFEVSGNLGDVAWAGIGQYNDLVSPLHAAMIAGAVANGGVMMEPKLLCDVDAGGMFSFQFAPSEYRRVMSAEEAETIKGFMKEVVQSGTGTSAKVKGANIFGKTGTAEYEEDGEVKNHSWFVGFTDDETHPYAIAIIGEGAGFGSRYAAPLAGKIFGRLLER